MLLFALAVASLFIPAVFRFALRHGLAAAAWSRGASVGIERVEGSFYEPVRIVHSQWSSRSRAGALTRVEVARAEAAFSWRALLSRSGGRWFQRLTLEGVSGKVEMPPELPPDAPPAAPKARLMPWLGRWPLPARIEARGVDFVVQSGVDFVRLHDSRWTISELEPGTIAAAQIVIKQPWLARTFRDVRGTTALKGSQLLVADLTLEPGVAVKSFSAELRELARGRLNMDLRLAAFGGEIRVQAQTFARGGQPPLEAIGDFSQIGVAPLATFLGVSDAAGGSIKEGKFTFRGSPSAPARASASLRLEATNFQWETRQWDSLAIGATLVDRRVQIPELELRQGHNQLSLNGEVALPAARTSWWKTEFNFNIAAAIENLTELSALMLPEFKYAAGKVHIDGAVRGRGQQFHGTLIASGSGITWRDAPIDDLHAAIRLNGNELQVANFELLNGDDFLRGRGVVNIVGPPQYWGELRGSVRDLSTYAALLQKPILPEPLAGGAVVNWSGEGSAKGHSGRLFAHLEKLRTLGASAALLHPVNAELEGSYSPGAMQFSRFVISDDESSFTANVTVGNMALSLRSIRLAHGADAWLQGDAVLPLDLWKAWPNTSVATLLTDATPVKINLTATGLPLREASRLSGWNWPIEGTLDGHLEASGILGALETSGRVTLRAGRIPLGSDEERLTAVEGVLAVRGQTLAVEKFDGHLGTGEVQVRGEIDFENLRDPALNLGVQTRGIALRNAAVAPVLSPDVFASAAPLFPATRALARPLESSSLTLPDTVAPAPSAPEEIVADEANPEGLIAVTGTTFHPLFTVQGDGLPPSVEDDRPLVETSLRGLLGRRAEPSPVASARWTLGVSATSDGAPLLYEWSSADAEPLPTPVLP